MWVLLVQRFLDLDWRANPWVKINPRFLYYNMIDYKKFIQIDKEIRSGKPCIKGTRISVGDILSFLASEMSEKDILEDFPELTHESILAALAYASEKERSTSVLVA